MVRATDTAPLSASIYCPSTWTMDLRLAARLAPMPRTVHYDLPTLLRNNLEQVVHTHYAQANSVSYPQWDGK